MIFKKWHLTSLSKKWLLALGGICLCFVAYDLITWPASDVEEPVIEVLPAASTPAGQDGQNEQDGQDAQDAQETAVAAHDFSVDASEIKGDGSDFFAAYRMEREQVRARETQMLENIIANEQVSADAREAANSRKLAISKAMDQEMQIENLIKAKDYEDAAAFIQDGSATVVVCGELDDKAALIVADLVQGVSGIGMERLVIIEK